MLSRTLLLGTDCSDGPDIASESTVPHLIMVQSGTLSKHVQTLSLSPSLSPYLSLSSLCIISPPLSSSQTFILSLSPSVPASLSPSLCTSLPLSLPPPYYFPLNSFTLSLALSFSPSF